MPMSSHQLQHALAGLIHPLCIYAMRVHEPANDTCQLLIYSSFTNNYAEVWEDYVLALNRARTGIG